MGNACAPDESKEPLVDTETIPAAEPEGGQDEGRLIKMLNSLKIKNEQLTADLQKAHASHENEKGEEAKLADEVKDLKDQLARKEAALREKEDAIQAEEKRIATLKLQNAIIRQEAKVYRNQKNTSVLIEGNLFKFTKAGKGKKNMKHVIVNHRDGDIADDGYTAGQLTLCWADDEKSTELSRAVVTNVMDGSANVKSKECEGRVFTVEVKPKKLLAFLCETKASKDKWFSTISGALKTDEKLNEDMNEEYYITLKFEKRPLGFRVEEQFIPNAKGTEDEVLVVAMVQESHEHLRGKGLVEGLIITKCNDIDFTGMTYNQKLEVIKKDGPITLTFKGRGYLKKQDSSRMTIDSTAHNRDVSMQALYQQGDLKELQDEITKSLQNENNELTREELLSHPLVKKNPELKVWLERPDFKELVQELISDPVKFREFIQNREL